ncbi:MAG: hypothetical protein IT299_10385 [Dehalococcoidia bacterium]|nr:hypothetical protein [Dehalococcoidia bacterium]
MTTWLQFAAGGATEARPAEVLRTPRVQRGSDGRGDVRGERGQWVPFEGGSSALAAAGERLLTASPGIAYLGTVSAAGVPRVHPFMPRVVDGDLVAFVIAGSPKARDLLEGRPCVVYSALADEDEEFWVRGTAWAIDDRARIEGALQAMPWAKLDTETLMAFEIRDVGWTRWVDFGTPDHRPLHHRWRAA